MLKNYFRNKIYSYSNSSHNWLKCDPKGLGYTSHIYIYIQKKLILIYFSNTECEFALKDFSVRQRP